MLIISIFLPSAYFFSQNELTQVSCFEMIDLEMRSKSKSTTAQPTRFSQSTSLEFAHSVRKLLAAGIKIDMTRSKRTEKLYRFSFQSFKFKFNNMLKLIKCLKDFVLHTILRKYDYRRQDCTSTRSPIAKMELISVKYQFEVIVK